MIESIVRPMVCAAAVFALLAAPSSRGGDAATPAATCIETAAAAERRAAVDAWLHGERLPGVAVAAAALRVSAAQGGRIEALRVATGSSVEAGAVLLDLNSDALRDALRAIDAERRIDAGTAVAQRAEVERLERERERRIAHPDLFAREEREAHDALLAAARARLESAEAREDATRLRKQTLHEQQAALRVVAPAAGVVGKIFVRAGETVSAGAPLVELSMRAGTLFRFALPVQHAARLQVGDDVCVQRADQTVAPVPARVQAVGAQHGAAEVLIAEATPLAPLVEPWQGLAIDVLPTAERAR